MSKTGKFKAKFSFFMIYLESNFFNLPKLWLLSPVLHSFLQWAEPLSNDLAPVVQTSDSAIHQINHYPADSVIDFRNTYPLDSDLSGG